MKLNINFARPILKPDGTPDYAPASIYVTVHHHEEWDEPVIDPETGEPTGATEHKSRDWDERVKRLWPTAEEYLAEGYVRVVDLFPSDPAPDGKHWEPRGWKIEPKSATADMIVRVYVLVDDPLPPPRVFVTADLVEALMAEGIWDDVRAWIVERGMLDLVLATAEFTEDNANFAAGRAALQAALGWTDEEVEELLAQCVKGGV